MRFPFKIKRTVHHEAKSVVDVDKNAKSHHIHVKSNIRWSWKSVSSPNDLSMHDVVRLAKKPNVEGEVRHIDHERSRVEFNHLGTPVFAKLKEIKKRFKK